MTLSSKPQQLPDSEDKYGNAEFTAAFRCDNEECRRLSIGQGTVYTPGSGGSAEEVGKMLASGDIEWTPRKVQRPPFPDVPEQIAQTASEAHACLSIQASRGAVALARAVVEATAKDKGITTGRLVQKIDALHADGHIREFTRQVAHEVRYGGNEIAHGDLAAEPMPAADAAAIVGLMDEILQEVYQAPAKMLRLKTSRLEREKRNTEQQADS